MNSLKQKLSAWLIVGAMASALSGCSTANTNTDTNNIAESNFNGTVITLSDDGVLVDGQTASTDSSSKVYVSNDIIYYEEGQDSSYGEGTLEDEHTSEEAEKHTVVTISEPGNYSVSGTLSFGQILIDLGEDAQEDPEAVVNLTLDNVDLTSTVSSAIVALNAYECSAESAENPSKDVDTSDAGFNLILADDSVNVVNGSHVAKIYAEGTSKKKYKFDGAVESKVTMTINGEEKSNGQLTVNADNEGIETYMHLTINGGILTINSADDAINANEDGISVLTINGGVITCDSGAGSEGDGIDSNGWIVINGGYTIASANPASMDSGVDSDMGIYINGGTLLASGNMYDEIAEDSTQKFIVLNFNEKQNEDDIIVLKNSKDEAVAAFSAVNDYTILVYSSDLLEDGDYTLAKASSVTGDLNGSIYTNISDVAYRAELEYSTNGSNRGMGHGGMKPEGEEPPADGERPERPEGEKGERPEGQMPEGERPNDFKEGEQPIDTPAFDIQNTDSTEKLTSFTLSEGGVFLYSLSEIAASE